MTVLGKLRTLGPGLFLGSLNWGGIDKYLGGVNMCQTQIYMGKH